MLSVASLGMLTHRGLDKRLGSFIALFGICLIQWNVGNICQCLCQLPGHVSDCNCTVNTVDAFNNIKVYPMLETILKSDYFRFYKINLRRQCPYWVDHSKCSLRDCSVKECTKDEIPLGIMESFNVQKRPHDMYSKSAQRINGVQECEHDLDNLRKPPTVKTESDVPVRPTAAAPVAETELRNENDDGEEICDERELELGSLDTTISDYNKDSFQKWQEHDDAQHDFCEPDDDRGDEAIYVDLHLNPERYTGYRGDSAHQCWKSIYLENCFEKESFIAGVHEAHLQGDIDRFHKLIRSGINSMCLEKRAFYRAMSGLHSSINIHLSSMFLMPGPKGTFDLTAPRWGRNTEEFIRRFSPETTNGEGPHWLQNLYFLYLLELRALAKAAPYLKDQVFFTGEAGVDNDVRTAVTQILDLVETFPNHFNESVMFNGQGSAQLKEDFRMHFKNVSRIMDCVGCDKCKLWGKLQIQGMGTAFKILFVSDKHKITLDEMQRLGFRLRRSEIVSLFNAFGRLSRSIYEIEEFRKELRFNYPRFRIPI